MRRPRLVKDHGPATLLAAIAVFVALAGSCRSAGPPARPAPPTPPAVMPAPVASAPLTSSVESLVPAPVLRVGIITEAARTSVAADSGVVLKETGSPHAGASVQRATFVPASLPVLVGPHFLVQVASLADEAAAREAASRGLVTLGSPNGVRALVVRNEASQTWQARLGYYLNRDEAASAQSHLTTIFPGCWVVTETDAPGGRIRLLETGQEFAAVTVFPAHASETLTADGQPYRGLLEVRPGEAGGLTVVNIVNMEDYLRGVVPNELSPSSFPRLEALKAQAVAARTYALRNRGQFQAKGYDICATPTCQVYKGKSTEHALTDEAVEATKGIAASYHGALINALYTSTCGGQTEDGDNMFEGEPVPYLRGVYCEPERSAWGSISTAASTRMLGETDGLNHDAALLVSLGVLEPHQYTSAALKGPLPEREARVWAQRLVSALKRQGCSPEGESWTRRGGFFRGLVESLCWTERAKRLLAPGDTDYLLQVEDRSDFKNEAERLASALLIQEGILSPFADNTLREGASITKVQAVGVLARTAEKAGAPTLLSAEFEGVAAGKLTVRRGEEDEAYPLDPAVKLFRSLDGARMAASELNLTVGDKLSFVTSDGRVTFLEAHQDRLGAAADHSSRYYRWEVRLTPTEVAHGLSRYGSVGDVRDLIPRRLGVSGRVVELGVLGTRGELTLKGIKVRWALGLRENLFVVDRERAKSGAVERFVFTGKGWGHGVGLCQVGAFGMAQAGASYEDILRHYYRDIALQRMY